jgi:uridine phosphorylase
MVNLAQNYKKYPTMGKIPESELVLNPDGSVYHLKLKPEHIADTVLLAGDPNRISMISAHFDSIEYKIENREFTTHTGFYKGVRITALSTGIGTDNIDIAINELDAAVNIDLVSREVKKEFRKLKIIRLGTSGALQSDVLVDSCVISTHGLGLDGLLNFYNVPKGIIDQPMTDAFFIHSGWGELLAKPYIVEGSSSLIKLLGEGMTQGITATSPGFYGPQGRVLRLPLSDPLQNDKITTFSYNGARITNYEMETSALYGLGKMLGHDTCTVCAIIANRLAKAYSKDYKKTVEKMIITILERLSTCPD